MTISYKWLHEYLPQKIELNTLTDILTAIGLEVEGVEKKEEIKGGLEGLVIGEVISCEPHPNADRLKITKVRIDQAGEPLEIVCGAPNVAVRQKVVVAPVGSTVHPINGDPFPIRKAKIRGALSEGMICSESEIGLGARQEGILVLPDAAEVGKMAKEHFSIPEADYAIEIGLTPNRSDANSHIGVAKDVCAYLSHHQKEKVEAVLPQLAALPEPEQLLPITVELESKQRCKRYAGITLRDIQVTTSPQWLQQRLSTIGLQPVNNVVDITNFVLHEYGQPLHAFDYDQIKNKTIVVRDAAEGEQLKTLDEKNISLNTNDLVIADESEPMCLAGIYGGLDYGITEKSTSVFLESAYFDPKTIRKSSIRHKLRTDAATHFEKGVAMEMVVPALLRAASLLIEFAGAKVASTLEDIYPDPILPRTVQLDYDYLNKLCGKSYEPPKVVSILQALGFKIVTHDENSVRVEVPGENQDIFIAADLAEEILRIDGLDNIEAPSKFNISLESKAPATNRQLKEKIANYLAHSGWREIITNSLTNSKYYPENQNLVRLVNALSVDLDVMRPSMLESGLEVIEYNLNRKQQDLKLFEFGKTYVSGEKGKYSETEHLALWMTGDTDKQTWRSKAKKADEFDLKGIVENILRLCDVKSLKESVGDEGIEWKRGKEVVASLKKVAGEKLAFFGIKQEVFYAEFNVAHFVGAQKKSKLQFRELPKFPSMKRDLALVLDKNISYGQVAELAEKQRFEALKDYELFDVFEDKKLGEGKKSLALSFTFQMNDRTLTDNEVDAMMQSLIRVYENELNALIRS